MRENTERERKRSTLLEARSDGAVSGHHDAIIT